MKTCVQLAVAVILCFTLSATAQTPGTMQVVPPPLIQFSGLAADEGGSSLSGVVSITFSLYIGQQGGEPLWTETQNNVQLDPTGHYSVQLGITKPNGVPTTLFTMGEARWLGVRIAEQAEQPRVLLVSVPYSLKAGDAATLGGLPPSAFVLAAPQNAAAPPSVTESASGQSAPPPSGAVTGTGTVNFIPMWDTTSDIISSVIFQSGTGSTGKIGINTIAPASTLDVKGSGTIRGALSLPSTGTATTTKGANSQPLVLVTSAFNSSTSKAVTQTFQWQAEPVENDTSSPSGSFNLLFGSGTTKPTETGLNIASNGQINFAPGQIFPGAGTITGVTTASGSGLTGGGTSGTLNLGLTNTCGMNQVLQWNGSAWACATVSGGGGSGTVTSVGTGLGLLGGPITTSGTLTIDTTRIPQLGAANIFSGNQAVNGNLSATGIVTGSSFQIGSNLFGFGSYANSNAFLGFAGNTTMTGGSNTASGFEALYINSTGSNNTASGAFALLSNSSGNANTAVGSGALSADSGSQNTAVGASALSYNTAGNQNTALGVNAGVPTVNSNTTAALTTFLGYNTNPGNQIALNNATAIGANAQVTANNAMVLGSINGVNGATASTQVGIGTTAPLYSLDVHGTGNFTGLINFAAGQTFPGTGTITGVTTAGGSGLTGGGTGGTLSLGLTNACAPGQVLQWSGVAWACATVSGGGGITGVIAGTDLLGGGSSGNVTLNLDTTRVPTLFTNNSFQGNQIIAGNVTAAGTVSANTFLINNTPFAFGTIGTSNAFLGFAGNSTSTGNANTATGTSALASNTNGSYNTATGALALNSNTGGTSSAGSSNTATGYAALLSNNTGQGNTAVGVSALGGNSGDSNGNGSYNTGVGYQALSGNTTGNYNSAFGYTAGPNSNNFINATAIGAFASVAESNAVVLGSIAGTNGASSSANIGIGTTKPAYTLDVHGTGNFTGLVNFASGQTFPGTIAGVTTASGSGLTGGGTSGTLNLGLTNACATGQVLEWNGSAWACTGLSGGGTITGVNPGTGLKGGGNSGTVTLAVDPTQVPLLSGGNLTVNGNLSATGVVTGSSFQIGSNLFAFGSYTNANAFLGFAGNTGMTGGANTAIGRAALASNTTGGNNTASGWGALAVNTTGVSNTASGVDALMGNTSGYNNTAAGFLALAESNGNNNTADGYSALTTNNGSNNTAVGYNALSSYVAGSYDAALGSGADVGSSNVSYATAIGANAIVSASNAMALGAPGALSSGAGQVNVGIGTATPAYRLDVNYGDMIVRGLQNFTLSGQAANLYVGDDFHVIKAVDGQGIFITSASANGLLVADGGNVGIGTAAPDNLLSVNGSADKPGGGSWGTFSDRRLKTLDGSFSSGLGQVLQINPVRYRYKEKNAMGIRDREEHVGLVAQDVQKVIPEAVTENNQGYLLVNNDPIIWAMLNAIKEQQTLIRQQQKQIKNQRAQIAHLTSQVKTIQAVLKTESQAVPEFQRAKVNLAHQ